MGWLDAYAEPSASTSQAQACRAGARHCDEWVLVVALGMPLDNATAWMEARGWPVRRRLDGLSMLMV